MDSIIPDFNVVSWSFSPNIDVAIVSVGLSYMVIIVLGNAPSPPALSEFSHASM